MDATPVAHLAQPRSQLVDRGVQSGGLVGRGGLGTYRRTTRPQGHLDARGAVVLARIRLVADVHFDAPDLLALTDLVDAVKLLDDLLAELFGDLAVAALDDNFHSGSRFQRTHWRSERSRLVLATVDLGSARNQ